MHESKSAPTRLKNDIEKIARTLEGVALSLETNGNAQWEIEAVHDERGRPEIEVGIDGFPLKPQTLIDWPSYKAITWHIRSLAESARDAAGNLPNSREKPAIKFAAQGLLHLRHYFGFPRPSIYNNSEDVQELKSVCESAGIFLSDESYRGALSTAYKSFDPFLMETYFDELFQ